MKIIAHRANIDGPSEEENSPKQIDKCIDLDYDVEIDIRYDLITKKIWLGHDNPQYEVDYTWLNERKKYLWIHCKNIQSLCEFSINNFLGYNYFWHQIDDHTLTSKNYIWSYPGKPHTTRSIIVMPELNMEITSMRDLRGLDCYGICTDYPRRLL